MSKPAVIQVARPRLPQAQAIQPYLEQIDANAWYSNHGPLAQLLQRRLAEHWGVAATEVALTSNATASLTLALQASGARPGSRCLMPSWTFVASAGAVVAAGLVPHFVDVCPTSWAPEPSELQRLARLHDIGAILVVAPFGAPIDLEAWDRVREETGLPVVIDAAAAFDALRNDGPMPVGHCPVAVSLHATKAFGIGEGGALIARDPSLMRRVRSLAQFGFAGTREAQLAGINAKLSEYGAAVGLAGLDTWAETRARWQLVTDAYRTMLPPALTLTPGFGRDWIASTLSVLWPADQPDLADRLVASGIATLSWWGLGCHTQPAFRHCPAEALPVTSIYAPRAVGLPFWQDLSLAQVEKVCAALRLALGRGRAPLKAKARAAAQLVAA